MLPTALSGVQELSLEHPRCEECMQQFAHDYWLIRYGQLCDECCEKAPVLEVSSKDGVHSETCWSKAILERKEQNEKLEEVVMATRSPLERLVIQGERAKRAKLDEEIMKNRQILEKEIAAAEMKGVDPSRLDVSREAASTVAIVISAGA